MSSDIAKHFKSDLFMAVIKTNNYALLIVY